MLKSMDSLSTYLIENCLDHTKEMFRSAGLLLILFNETSQLEKKLELIFDGTALKNPVAIKNLSKIIGGASSEREKYRAVVHHFRALALRLK